MNVKVVGTGGRVDYQKAPEIMIDALARLHRSDVYAVWVGDGPLRENMRLPAKQRGLGERFLFTGERSDVPALLPAFDVFTLTL